MKSIKSLLLLGLCAAMPAQAQLLSQLLNNAAQAVKNSTAPPNQATAQTSTTPSDAGCVQNQLTYANCRWDLPPGAIRMDTAGTPHNNAYQAPEHLPGALPQNLALFSHAIQLDGAGKVPLLHEQDTLLAAASQQYASTRSLDRQDAVAGAQQAAVGMVERYPLGADYVVPALGTWFEYDAQRQVFPVRFALATAGLFSEREPLQFGYRNPEKPGSEIGLHLMIPELYNSGWAPGNAAMAFRAPPVDPNGGEFGREYDIQVPLAQAHAFLDRIRHYGDPTPNAPTTTLALLHLKPVRLEKVPGQQWNTNNDWFVVYQLAGITWYDRDRHAIDLGP